MKKYEIEIYPLDGESYMETVDTQELLSRHLVYWDFNHVSAEAKIHRLVGLLAAIADKLDIDVSELIPAGQIDGPVRKVEDDGTDPY